MTKRAPKRPLPTMNEEQAVEYIRSKQNGQTLTDYAAEIGISAPYLSEIYNGTRSPGEKVLTFFGMTKERTVITVYRFE